MKIRVDLVACASIGSCMQICPEVFEIRKDGYLYLLTDELDAALKDKVVKAVENCLNDAISIED